MGSKRHGASGRWPVLKAALRSSAYPGAPTPATRPPPGPPGWMDIWPSRSVRARCRACSDRSRRGEEWAGALASYVVAFSDGKPDSTFPENGLALAEPDDEQQDHCAERRVDDPADHAAADHQADFGEQPRADDGADDADNDVADESEAIASDDFASEPAGDGADHQQCDQTYGLQRHDGV